MNINAKEFHILQHCEFRARRTVGTISKASGYPEHSVRYHLKRLEKQGAIAYTAVVNLFRLGYSRHSLFFSLSPTQGAIEEELVSWLCSHPNVLWVGELGTDFQFGVGICTTNSYDLLRFEYNLASKFPNRILHKAVTSQFSATLFARTWDEDKVDTRPSMRVGVLSEHVEIDVLDHKILTGLVSSSFKSRRKLAGTLQVPLSTLELRISKLEEMGVIAGYIYRINPSKVGLHPKILLINTQGISQDYTNALYDFARNTSSVCMCLECFGVWDYELNVDLSSEDELQEVVRGLHKRLGGAIQGIKVLNRFRDHLDLLYPSAVQASSTWI